MAPTVLQYLEEMDRYESQASVLETKPAPDGRLIVILGSTIFYPQGGGQACDTGNIEAPGFKLAVEAVALADGIVLHTGASQGEPPSPGTLVKLTLNQQRRYYNSCLQSAGHLIVNALWNIGHSLEAKKGYHFPDSPFVEFAGTIPESERDAGVKHLQQEINRLIELDLPITWQFVPAAKMHELCKNVPTNVPTDKPIRVVTIDDVNQPCGGTHVRSLGALKGLTVEKIKVKKGDTRISYSVPVSTLSSD